MKPGRKGLSRIYHAMLYALAGWKAAFKYEAAFRQELLGFIILVPVALWLGESALEKAILIIVMILVLVTELLNSAIEAVVDRFGGEIHALSGRAKDLAAAAVMTSFIGFIVVWLIVLLN